MMMAVRSKPSVTGAAFCGAVMDITMEADRQTRVKLRYQLRLFSSIADGSDLIARCLRPCTHGVRGLNFVWGGTKDLQDHINYEKLVSLSGISEYWGIVGCDAVSRRFETPSFSETAGTIQINGTTLRPRRPGRQYRRISCVLLRLTSSSAWYKARCDAEL